MTLRKVQVGTRVRLIPPHHIKSAGWRGCGTVLVIYPTMWKAITDGRNYLVDACDWQWAIMRDQTPNPEHTEAVRQEMAGECAYFYGGIDCAVPLALSCMPGVISRVMVTWLSRCLRCHQQLGARRLGIGSLDTLPIQAVVQRLSAR
jgi:hypothetical protein